MLILAAFNPALFHLVLVVLLIVGVALVLKYFRQPYIIAYILAGVLIGDNGFKLITDEKLVHLMGEIGLILLLFFIGMEISLPKLVKRWKVPTFGTLFQIIGSVIMLGIIGWYLNWTIQRIVVLGFIISLSSSAVVIKVLQDNAETQSRVGENVISILLMQDILIVPLLLITKHLGGAPVSNGEIILQVLGGVIIIACMVWLIRKQSYTLPFGSKIAKDHELQVFLAMLVCVGFAVFTGMFGLSAALGAFVGGMFIHAAKSTDWIHDSLHAFRVVFVAIFFISIGIMIDLTFIVDNWQIIAGILLAVYLGNHFINAVVIHYFGRNWRESLYGGALLAQIGELSFILSSVAYYADIISDYEYQLTIVIVSLTLFISPFWISLTKRLVGFKHTPIDRA